MLRYFRVIFSALEKTKKHTRIKMDKKRLRVALKVLERVKEAFLDTKHFIEDLIDKECQKEKISVDKIFFLQV